MYYNFYVLVCLRVCEVTILSLSKILRTVLHFSCLRFSTIYRSDLKSRVWLHCMEVSNHHI